MSRNNVRGPTSALTEFLRDAGITAESISRRAATRTQSRNQDRDANVPEPEQQPEAGPSSAAAPARPTRRAPRRSGYGSDNLDEDEEEAAPTPAKKRKLTKAQEEKMKAKEKEKAKKKKGGKGSDDDFSDEEDTYTAPSKSAWTSNAKPPIGSFANCAVCGNRFTASKYTMASKDNKGWVCHPCTKAGGADPFKKPAPRKRKTPADKRTVTHFEDKRCPSLVSLCVTIITKHIDDIDAFGDIGSMNRENIAKALAKNRSLTPENAKLFYSVAYETLTFYDATRLPPDAIQSLAHLNPNLRSLRLDFCGQMDDNAMKVLSTGLPKLERIELLGPFLVRSPAWQEFFKSHPKLTGFLITQSPRFDLDATKALVEHCPNIQELRLKEVGKMSDEIVEELEKLGTKQGLLWRLDLSDPSKSCSEESLSKLVNAVSKSLTHLDLSSHDLLATEDFFTNALINLDRLENLTLARIPDLTDEVISEFFNNWPNPPLHAIDLSRNPNLSSASLEALIKHSGSNLHELNINGWKDVSEEALRIVATGAPLLRRADVGWCRAFDDFVLKAWLEGEETVEGGTGVLQGGCQKLTELKVWGCNRISASCPRRKGLVIQGVESHQVR